MLRSKRKIPLQNKFCPSFPVCPAAFADCRSANHAILTLCSVAFYSKKSPCGRKGVRAVTTERRVTIGAARLPPFRLFVAALLVDSDYWLHFFCSDHVIYAVRIALIHSKNILQNKFCRCFCLVSPLCSLAVANNAILTWLSVAVASLPALRFLRLCLHFALLSSGSAPDFVRLVDSDNWLHFFVLIS